MEIDFSFGHPVYVCQLSQMVAGEDDAVFNLCRQCVHADADISIGLWDFEEVVGRNFCIPVAAESRDEFEFFLVDQFLVVEQFVVDVYAKHFGDDELSGAAFVAQWFYFDDLTFQFRFCFFYQRRFYQGGFFFGEPCFFEFVGAFGKLAAGERHLVYHVVGNDVDHHFGHFENIFEAVLGGVVAQSSCRREDDDGWVVGEEVKEAERAEVDGAVFGDGGCQGDGAWCNEVLQVMLFFDRGEVGGVECHFFVVGLVSMGWAGVGQERLTCGWMARECISSA